MCGGAWCGPAGGAGYIRPTGGSATASQPSMPGSLAPLLLLLVVVMTAGQLPPSTLRHGGLEVPNYLARVPSFG